MCVRNLGWAVKKSSIRHIIFLVNNWTNHQRQKRCARVKLVGAAEKILKSYKLKV